MMNPMQPQQMGGMGGTPELTDEELRKLALLLQQMPEMQKNIDGQQHEMSYLTGTEQNAMETVRRDPGLTQSLAEQGKEMQPRYENGIRAFPIGGGDEGDQESGFGGSSGGSGDNPDAGGIESETNLSSGLSMKTKAGDIYSGKTDSFPGIGGAGFYGYSKDYQPPSYRGTFEGDGVVSQPQPQPEAPPTYKDKNGFDHSSQAEADAANDAIDATNAKIEGETLTTDTTFGRWMARNKDTYPIPPNTEAQLLAAFNTAKTKSTEAAAAQLPKIVDTMNVYLRDYGPKQDFEQWFNTITDKTWVSHLSEATLRNLYAKAVFKIERKEAFTLTQDEVAAWTRPAVQIATTANFEEWWAGQGREEGLYPTKELAEKAHKAAQIADADDIDIKAPTAATAPVVDQTTVGEITDADQTTIDAISEVTDADMDVIFEGIDEAEALLLARVEGTAVSPAEVQLKRSVENNLRMLLGATVGGDADPARVRQLKNIWADQVQEVTGKAAELRSEESMAAEKELVALYKDKSTMKLNTKLANLEVEKQTAFKNGDLELAGKLANQQARLTHVITQANITSTETLSEADMKLRTGLANLQAMKDIAIEQGKLDLATSLGNLQKNIVLATTNTTLAVQQRSMDDSVAMAAFKGEMALMGLEVDIDFKQMDDDLARLGIATTVTLAEMDAKTQKEVATLIGMYNREAAKTTRDNKVMDGIITLIGTALGGYAALKGSDIRAKTNISPGAGEVESFLDALNAYTYEYKDPDAPGADAGMFTGVMAQDLEKTPMGASFVKDTPQGKQVDYGHGLAAILASQANIHDRLKQLEEG